MLDLAHFVPVSFFPHAGVQLMCFTSGTTSVDLLLYMLCTILQMILFTIRLVKPRFIFYFDFYSTLISPKGM